MKEIINKDIWEIREFYDCTCITTNGILKKDESLVMGAGIALQAARKFPDLPKIIGFYVKKNGNKPVFLSNYKLITFPTKNHWKDNSDIKLITQSAELIVEIVNYLKLERILSPPPGCGNGNLKWEKVKPILNKIFDERFTICIQKG